MRYLYLFENKMMNLQVNIPLEEALNLGWKILSECFTLEEIGMKKALTDKFWPEER